MRLFLCLILGLFTSCAFAADQDDNKWRAGAEVLAERVERLARGGEVDAAASVLQELLSRPDIEATGLDDRARMALARGYLAQQHTHKALKVIQQIPWADKHPEIASAIIAIELAIRWSGIQDDNGRLRSGVIPARDVVDSASGHLGGPMAERAQHFHGLSQLLVRGAKMVEAEGGTIQLPADPRLLALAEYAHGSISVQQLAERLGAASQWPVPLVAAVSRLHLEEHQIEEGIAAAEVLWRQHTDSDAARDIFGEWRTWQLRRETLAKRLRLWAYPQIYGRLDELAQVYAEKAASIADQIQKQKDIQGLAIDGELIAALEEREQKETAVEIIEIDSEVEVIEEIYEGPYWKIATFYEGLSLRCQKDEIPAGDNPVLSIRSDFSGPHLIAVYEFKDRKGWSAFKENPRRELLPQQTKEVVEVPKGRYSCTLPKLAEGFYVATVVTRGSPVVVLTGFVVVDPDLYVLASRDEVLAWVVSRQTAQAKAGEPVVVQAQLVRNSQAAAGAAWLENSTAWQAGFTSAFLQKEISGYLADHQAEDVEAGRQAGLLALADDPPQELSERVLSNESGQVCIAIPKSWQSRSYRVKVHIDRPEIDVARSADWGHEASWQAKTVAWADRPLVRPGESFGWRGILREHDGDRYRLPIAGQVSCRIELAGVTLFDDVVTVGIDGSIHGEVVVPPASREGELKLHIGASQHRLAKVRAVKLPNVVAEISGVEPGDRVRVGSRAPVQIVIRDASGEPIEGIEVKPSVSMFIQGEQIPTDPLPVMTTDIAGRVAWKMPTDATSEANFIFEGSFVYNGKNYFLRHGWQTEFFPFSVETIIKQRSVRVGEYLRVKVRMPAQAGIQIGLGNADRFYGDAKDVPGREDGGWQDVIIPVTQELLRANYVLIQVQTLSGPAIRRLPIKVQAAREHRGDRFALHLGQSVLDPAEEARVMVTTDQPGSHALLVGGARQVILRETLKLDKPVFQHRMHVPESWAPNIYLQAVAYRNGRFVETKKQNVQVRPIHRLLRVALTVPEGELRPGSDVEIAVQVSNWQDQPVAHAHLSLGAVDEALYALEKDQTPDLWDFFHSYSRSWSMERGSKGKHTVPQATLWRSVIWMWQGEEGAFGNRYGGSKRRACGRYGGSMSSVASIMIEPEDRASILWLGDLVTDDKGQAVVTLTLPKTAATWRLTARANDASAAPLVGEIRQEIVARYPVQVAIQAPSTARPGADIPIKVQLHNRKDKRQSVEVALAGNAPQTVVLPAKSRREVLLRYAVLANADQPYVERGGLLGHIQPVQVEAIVDGHLQETSHKLLVVCDGMPESGRWLLRADESGLVSLPNLIQKGDTVRFLARAWGGVSDRAKTWLREQRSTEFTNLRHLLEPPSKRRRLGLAKAWKNLGTGDLVNLVKQEAAIHGTSFADMRNCKNAFGQWLIARGRARGMDLPAPRRHGFPKRQDSQYVTAVATARLEGWREAAKAWLNILADIRSGKSLPGDHALNLAILAETARMLGQEAEAEELYLRLGSLHWSPLAGALAVVGLHGRRELGTSSPKVVNGQGTGDLTSGPFSEWVGIAGHNFALEAEPGSLVEVNYTVQGLRDPVDDSFCRVTWWQQEGDRFYKVPLGMPLWPARPTIIQLTNTSLRDFDWQWYIGGVWQVSRTMSAVPLYLTAHPLWDPRDVLNRRKNHEDTADIVKNLVPVWPAVGQEELDRVEAWGLEYDELSGFIKSGNLSAGESCYISVLAPEEGTWAGGPLRVYTQRNGQELVTDVLIKGQEVQAGTVLLPEALPNGHPCADTLLRMAPDLGKSSWRWLGRKMDGPADEDTWRQWLRVLDETDSHTPGDLLRHPECGEARHWTTKKLHQWLNEDPFSRSGDVFVQTYWSWDTFEGLGSPDPDRQTWKSFRPSLTTLMRLVRDYDQMRRLVWQELPQPKQAPKQFDYSMKQWYQYLQSQRIFTQESFSSWLWDQGCQSKDILAMGYDRDLEGWVAFMREQCELDISIDVKVPVRLDSLESEWQFVGGPAMGSDSFLDQGLVVVPVGRSDKQGEYESWMVRLWTERLSSIKAATHQSNLISLNLQDEDIGDVVWLLNRLLKNRTQAKIDIDPNLIARGTAPITISFKDAQLETVLKWIAQLTDSKLEQPNRRHWRFVEP